MEHPASLAPPETESDRSLRARLTSESLAMKVCVGVLSEVILARLGTLAAVGGLIVSLTVEDVVEDFLRRRKWDKRTLWFVALLIWLLDHAEEALAKVGLVHRREREAGARVYVAPALGVVVAGALVIGAFTAADAVAGRSLVAHRAHTFYGGRTQHPHVLAQSHTITSSRTTTRAQITTTLSHRVHHVAAVVFAVPPGLRVSASQPVTVVYAASATRGGRAIALHCSPPSGSLFPIGTTSVSCTAAGATRRFEVIVRRRGFGPPLVLPPTTLRVEAEASSGAIAMFAARSGGGAVVSCEPPSGSTFALGRTTVRCVASLRGASTRGSFTVLVVDSTPPTIDALPLITAATTGDSAVVTYAAAARDAVDANVTVDCKPPSGGVFPLGRTTVTCTATDKSGNGATKTFVVQVSQTAVPVPTLRLPAPITVEATSADGAVVTFDAAAVDAGDGKLAADCSPPPATTFALGKTKVTCSATNSHGKTATGSFVVSVVDTTPPTISAKGPAKTAATSKAGAVVQYTATASDAVTSGITPSCSPASGSTFPIGSTTLTCTAADAAGNAAKRSFQITVYDGAPRLALKPAITLRAQSASGAIWKYTLPTASDAVDGPITASCSPAPGSQFPLGDSTLTCTAKDSAGNVVTATSTITVKDETAPLVHVPSSTVTVPYNTAVDYAKYVSAVDNVDGAVTPTCSPPSGSSFFEGDHTITCTATDKAGNTSAAVTWTVHVNTLIK
jgi:HYR domain